MTEQLDARPGGLNALFRAGNTFVATLTWPAGSLSGRTFTATLDAATLTVGIAGDVMTVTASEAQTLAATADGLFTLTETTGGPTEVLIVGRWSPSSRPAAAISTSAVVVTTGGNVTLGGTSDPSAVRVTGDQSVAGAKTFSTSPIVPNPVTPSGATKAISYGEVADILAAEDVLDGANTLYVGKFGNIPAFGQKVVGNTTTETTLLGSTPTVPTMTAGSTGRFVIAGDMKNSSGAAVNLTLRFKVAGTAIFTLVTSIPNDANTRPYEFGVELQNIGSSTANIVGKLAVHPGATNTDLMAVGFALLATQGGSSQTWDVSAQWATAASTITMQRLLANLTYTIAP